MDKEKIRTFLKDPLLKSWGLLNMSKNKLKIMMRLVTGYCHLRRHLFKLGLVDMHLKQPHMFFMAVRGCSY